ncbi:MAG: ABC transporter substrate-binding protein [Burkholderiales bacterium]|nr:ABC transporter substrate-binding protein [Burkholderiales bacterium]
MRLLPWCLLLGALPALAQPAKALVGAAVPQTGILAELAIGYGRALMLWQEEVNAGGGIHGREVELKLLDDRSEPVEAGRLYDQLVLEHKAEALIGPFGSAATLGAAASAERNRRVLVNGTGSARPVRRPNYRYVFQSAAPYSRYGLGALELARAEGLTRIALLARDDPVAREMAARARESALDMGFAVGAVERYAAGAEDFLPAVARARGAGVEAWIAFGLPRDAVQMVKAFRKGSYAPRLFVAQGAAQGDFTERLGQAAETAIGIVAYDPRARTRGNAGFVQAYARKWSVEPDAAAAEGYAAAKLLEQAARQAGSFDPERLRAALAAMQAETPIGAYRVDRSGAQIAAQPLLVQVQRGRPEIVWPEAYATARRLPYRSWAERGPQ